MRSLQAGLALLLLLGPSCSKAPQSEETSSPPNIILIMADDMGFSDIGCYGSEIETPNIDKLAAEGQRYSHFYNTGRCCPSRASLLTGRYAHAVGMGAMNTQDKGISSYTGHLSRTVPTIAELLQTQGYNTYMVGKWHLSFSDSIPRGPDPDWPTNRGFQQFYGTLEGAKDYFQPVWLHRNTTPVENVPDDYFFTRALADTAAQFIQHHNGDNPLFMYVAFYAPHFPLQAPDETLSRYRDKYVMGWDSIRNARFVKQQKLGIASPDARLTLRDDRVPAWKDLDLEKREEMQFRMELYAAQVAELDDAVGKIMAAVENSDLDTENTLVVFLSDNGAVGVHPYGRGEAKDLNVAQGPYTSYGAAWGQASNTPFRYYKQYTHEGGIAAPLIMHWPKEIINRGAINPQVTHIIDLAPTLLAASAHGGMPENAPEFDGRAMLEFREGNFSAQERTLFWEHLGARAARKDNWKLVSPGRDEPWELYDLNTDPTEMKNLVDQHPQKALELQNLWDTWSTRYQVWP